jgi:hypothetical protein
MWMVLGLGSPRTSDNFGLISKGKPFFDFPEVILATLIPAPGIWLQVLEF